MAGDRRLMGLDIGSTKVRCVIGTVDRDGELTVDSICERPSEGVRNGSIVNIEQTLKAILSVINEASLEAGAEIDEVITGVGGESIWGVPSNGVVGINSKNQEIRREDIFHSLEVARAFELPKDREIIHTLVQEFMIDGQTGIKDPVDMLGHRLESRVLIVTANSTVCQNERKCIQRAGLGVRRMVLESLADAEVVLSSEEKEMGVILINIGGGTTNMIVYDKGAPVYVAGIGMGGDVVTGDLSVILGRPRAVMEQIKCESGHSFVPAVSLDEKVMIPASQGSPAIEMPKQELSKIIEPRMAEIFSRLLTGMQQSGVRGNFASGLVLVGGGSLLSGVNDLAGEIFSLPTRLGFPEAIGGLDRFYINPSYTTLLGLLKSEAKRGKNESRRRDLPDSNRGGALSRVKDFFRTLW